VPASESTPILSQQLVLSIAEQLKLPLTQIARRAELASMDSSADFGNIRVITDSALQLMDSYMMGVGLALQDQYSLEVEPVSISSILYDTGQQLQNIAKEYGVELELNIAGKYGPVMAHRAGLQSALASLGYALIEAMPAAEGSGSTQLRLQLASHRCRYGIVAGLYSDIKGFSAEALRQGRRLHGHTRQPLTKLSHTSGAGVFVADSILNAMHSSLKVSRHHRLHGLGVVLKPTNQLQLV
jgi:hypothetical protein